MPSGTSSIEPPTSTYDQFNTAPEIPSTEEASDPDITNSQDSSDSQETHRLATVCTNFLLHWRIVLIGANFCNTVINWLSKVQMCVHFGKP